MKFLALLLFFFLSLSLFVSCGDDIDDAVCKNPCSQEQHADTRCKSSTVLETCTHLGGSCYSWVETKCDKITPVCKDDGSTPASCVTDGI